MTLLFHLSLYIYITLSTVALNNISDKFFVLLFLAFALQVGGRGERTP